MKEPRSPAATGHHAPNAIRPLDETRGSGSRRTAENLGVVDRIDPVQAAREHVGAVVATTAAVRRDRRTDAKNAERNGDSTRDKSYLVRPPAAHSAGASAAGFALRRPQSGEPSADDVEARREDQPEGGDADHAGEHRG